MQLSLFPKSLKSFSVDDLIPLMKKWNISKLELPIRKGYCITEDNMDKTFLPTVEKLKNYNIKVHTVSSHPEKFPCPKLIELCGKAGVPSIRIMAKINMEHGYFSSIENIQKKIEKILPCLKKNNVVLGVQNHADYWVGSALGLHQLLNPFPSDFCKAILDFAHCSLDGEPIDMAFDIIKNRILHCNFKSAQYIKIENNSKTKHNYQVRWGTHEQSLFSWLDAMNLLKKNHYTGILVLFAEYTECVNGVKKEILDNDAVSLVDKDIKYLNHSIGNHS